MSSADSKDRRSTGPCSAASDSGGLDGHSEGGGVGMRVSNCSIESGTTCVVAIALLSERL